MISQDPYSSNGRTTNDTKIGQRDLGNTPESISIDGDNDGQKFTINPKPEELDLKATPKVEDIATRDKGRQASILMDAFINYVKDSLNGVDGDYMPASDSGKIVVKCKSYLNSLLGNKIARRYIATTMLVVRNNYAELDASKRAKLIEFLDSYYPASKNHEVLQKELKKLYGSGIKPI